MPTTDEVAIALNTTAEALRELRLMAAKPASLDALIGSKQDTELGELIPDQSPCPEDLVDQALLAEQVGKLLSGLSESDRPIVQQRWGIGGDGCPKTLAEISKSVNLSREWVRNRQSKAFAKLRARAARQISLL